MFNKLGLQFNFQQIKSNAAQVYRFYLYSFAFTFCVLAVYLVNAEPGWTVLSSLYSLTIPMYYYLIGLFILTLLLPLFVTSALLPLVIVPKFIFDSLLIGNFFVFSVYRFHIDSLFLNMLIYDFKGIGISFGLVSIAVFAMAAIVGVNWYLYKVAKRHQHIGSAKRNTLLFVVFLVGQLIHVAGYEYKKQSITHFTPYVPYYQPLTSSSLMAKLQANYPSVFPARSEAQEEDIADILASSKNSGLLAYPKQPLSCEVEKDNKPNILIFIAESWRQDTMDETVTPNIYQFAQGANQYLNHYSGGSVTVNGLYSLMYGLHPTYRDFTTANPYLYQTLLTKTLAEQGYDIDVYTSSNLDRFSLKAMFFGKIADENYVNPLKENVVINDQKAIDALLADLAKPSDKPWFKFVFLSSSHHSYQYPEQHNLFAPLETNPEAFVFDKYMDGTGLYNDFRNSMHYVDKLFGDVWQEMSEQGLISNTMTIVTSDHGEEFNDNKAGYWGHGSNFTDYQVAVPFLMKSPGQVQQQLETKLTGHVDVTPTILSEVVQCQNPTSDYSNGFNLLDLPEQRTGLIMASYKDKAYLIDNYIYATGLSVNSYLKSDIKQENPKFDFSNLNKLKQEERALLKN